MNRLSGLPGLMSLLIFSKEDQMKVSYSSMTIKPVTRFFAQLVQNH